MICHRCNQPGEFRPRFKICKKCESKSRSERRTLNWEWEKEYKRRWRETNKAKSKVYNKVDCANSRADDKITAADVRLVIERDGYKCVQCDSKVRIELDHIVPLAKGGTNCLDNLQILCHDCNHRKGDGSKPVTNKWTTGEF